MIQPPQNDSGPDVDNVSTQACDTTNGTNERSIETIDITETAEPEIIVIQDEESRPSTNEENNHRSPSPSLLEDTEVQNSVTSSTNVQVPVREEITPDSDLSVFTQQNNIKPSAMKISKSSKPVKKEVCWVISDEEDEASQDIQNDAVENNATTNTLTRPIIEQTDLVDVSPTMNGLLRLKPETSPEQSDAGDELTHLLGFDTPSTGSPVNTSKLRPSLSSSISDVIIKPEPEFSGNETINLNYSMSDEIISLDSDEEDFPSSQLNASAIADVADYSANFDLLYEIKNELREYEEEDVKYGSEWFEPFSQTALAEDLRVESSKQYRQTESAEIPFNDVVDTSQESSDSNRKESDTSESIKQKFEKIPKTKSPKITIIEAPHIKRHKRRSVEAEPPVSKKLKGVSESNAIYRGLLAKERKSLKSPKKNRTHSSSSSAEVKEQRKQILKEIAQSKTKQESRSSGTLIDVTKIKKTTQNRGSFLTEELPIPAGVQKAKNDKKKDEPTSSSSSANPEEKEERLPSTSKESLKISRNGEKVKSSKHSKASSTRQIKDIPLDEVPQIAEETLKTSSQLSSSRPTNRIEKIIRKSILKDSKFRYENGDQKLKNKNIRFSEQNEEYLVKSWIKANGAFSPLYRKFETIIRDGQNEFDSALSTVCSWNVKWLQVSWL